MQPSESLYDQKPEEMPVQVSPISASDTEIAGSSFTSRFEYTENVQPDEKNSDAPRVLNHVAPPKSSNFFAEYGMDSGFPKKSSSSSNVQVICVCSFLLFYPHVSYCSRSCSIKCRVIDFIHPLCDLQVEETDEARKKFSNAKSISSAQFFGDQNKIGDVESSVTLQKFSVCLVIVFPDILHFFHLLGAWGCTS